MRFILITLIEKGICNGTIGIVTNLAIKHYQFMQHFVTGWNNTHTPRHTSYFYAPTGTSIAYQFQNIRRKRATLPNVLIQDSHMFAYIAT